MPPSVGEQVRRSATYALVLVLALLTALWGAFLVPLRVAGVPVPASLVVACVANLALGTAGARLYGRLGAALPGVVWFAVVTTLQSRRAEGDLVVPGSVVGLLFLLLGSICAAVPVGLAPARRRDTPRDEAERRRTALGTRSP